MGLFTEDIKNQLKEIFSQELNNNVNIAFFKKNENCDSCAATEEFLEEVTSLSEKINMITCDVQEEPSKAIAFGVDKTPAIVILDQDNNDFGVRFYGIPAGYEINSFIGAIREMSGKREELPQEVMDRIKAIDKEVHIQVFVTPTCPHCPGPVLTGHRLAMENEFIKADMVEATTFPDVSSKYQVQGVPKIVINETHEFVGGHPLSKFLEVIESL